jgi:hypothetical protein
MTQINLITFICFYDEAFMKLLEIPYQLEPPVHRFRCTEIQTIINSLHSKNLLATTSSQS